MRDRRGTRTHIRKNDIYLPQLTHLGCGWGSTRRRHWYTTVRLEKPSKILCLPLSLSLSLPHPHYRQTLALPSADPLTSHRP